MYPWRVGGGPAFPSFLLEEKSMLKIVRNLALVALMFGFSALPAAADHCAGTDIEGSGGSICGGGGFCGSFVGTCFGYVCDGTGDAGIICLQ
jgi:hypothetical protein